jgi:hypothetical protein
MESARHMLPSGQHSMRDNCGKLELVVKIVDGGRFLTLKSYARLMKAEDRLVKARTTNLLTVPAVRELY